MFQTDGLGVRRRACALLRSSLADVSKSFRDGHFPKNVCLVGETQSHRGSTLSLGSSLIRKRNRSAVYSRTKRCGQMVGLPVTLLCCLKLYLSFSPQLENKVALLVQVCQFLKLSPGIFCILNK